METARERKADLVLIQESPEFDRHRHPAFEFLRRTSDDGMEDRL